jgi:phage tail sheath protein FI
MPTYRAPGVYVEEVPSGTHPIGAVGTSVAGFVGTAPDSSASPNKAVAVTNWTQFTRIFAFEGVGFEKKEGSPPPEHESTPLVRAVYGFFENGGALCYIVNIGPDDPVAGLGGFRAGIQQFEEIDEIAIVAAPGRNDVASKEALLSHCEKMGDRVAIIDPPSEDDVDIQRLTKVATAPPPARPSGRASVGGTGSPATGSAPGSGSGSGEPPASGGGGSPSGGGDDDGGLRPRESAFGTYYFPEIQVSDPLSGESLYTAPSGHIAGLWGLVDSERGVHVTPANYALRGLQGLRQQVTPQEQELLNPKGVNCIRTFGTTTLVWGGRMLTPEADPLRYISVRRLMLMLKESIQEGTRWIVFRPNDYELWASIRLDISNFLTGVWRDGALFGRTPQQAFFVKCDEETNPPDQRDRGVVTTIIGVAPVKPAEFVVFKISQSAGGSESEIIGG